MLCSMKIFPALVMMFALWLPRATGAQTGPAADSAASPPATNVAIEDDQRQRMTVPVMVGTSGPWRFIVDTGADRSVVSVPIARQLNLPEARTVTLHTMNGVNRVQTVRVPRLTIGDVIVDDLFAPALDPRHLGADGVLGIDSLKDRRVDIDFRTGIMSVTPSVKAQAPREEFEIIVSARSRFGQLILVDADVYDQKLQVVLDTGAENSVGNEALRRLIQRNGGMRHAIPITLTGVTGEETTADYTYIDKLRVGGFVVTNPSIAFADVHPFRRFGLTRRPALLLGMDVLRKFDRVQIDFANRKIRFLLPRKGTKG